MKITKNTKLIVRDRRKGKFFGIAAKDFDTEVDEFYPILLDQPYLSGMANDWEQGEEVPCRRGISEVEVIVHKD